jgi:acyl-CoA synthetase (AMP-forming)/AMP-acid ligase II
MPFLLHHLLKKTASDCPDQIAVVFKDKNISYTQLDQFSDNVAAFLQINGIKKGDRIGFCFKKSIESIIVMFGILKSGGIYVPIDPSAPAERISFIIEDCSLSCLFSNNKIFSSIFKILNYRHLKLFVSIDEEPLFEQTMGDNLQL